MHGWFSFLLEKPVIYTSFLVACKNSELTWLTRGGPTVGAVDG